MHDLPFLRPVENVLITTGNSILLQCAPKTQKKVQKRHYFSSACFYALWLASQLVTYWPSRYDDFDAKLAGNINIFKFAGASPCISNLGNLRIQSTGYLTDWLQPMAKLRSVKMHLELRSPMFHEHFVLIFIFDFQWN